jgi:hypothetical protein
MPLAGRSQLHEPVGWNRVMSDTPQVLLAHHLKTLKLPTFLREYDKLARQCAAEGVDHVRYLVRLTELELIDRERRMIERRIRQAKFPAVKSLDSFDFKAIPSLNKMLVLELARSEYIDRHDNVIALGNSGTGKTHVALCSPPKCDPRLGIGRRSGGQGFCQLCQFCSYIPIIKFGFLLTYYAKSDSIGFGLTKLTHQIGQINGRRSAGASILPTGQYWTPLNHWQLGP